MLLSILISIFFFIIVIIILVSVHEFGHFITAKWAGAYVERFSIGMGPVLWKKKIGETEYCISIIPIGGYVKILGEDPEEADYTDPKNLQSKSSLQRLAVFASGSLNNIILALIVVSFSFMIGIQVPEYLYQEPVIHWVGPGSSAEQAGLKRYDKVMRINNYAVSTWQDFMENIGISPKETIILEIERGDDIVPVRVEPEQIKAIGLGVIAVMHDIEPVIFNIAQGYPAENAGLKKGDRVTAVNSHEVNHWNTLSYLIRNNIELDIMIIEVDREGEALLFEVTPQLINGTPGIGIERAPDATMIKRFSFFPAIKQGFTRNRDWVILTFRFLSNLVTNKASVRSVGGPIMIADVSGAIGRGIFKDRFGASQFLLFLGFISLQLGIINLLPLPVLDGGHILFLFFEKIFGREKIKKAKSVSQMIGIVLLITLAILVVINDILRITSSIS